MPKGNAGPTQSPIEPLLDSSDSTTPGVFHARSFDGSKVGMVGGHTDADVALLQESKP